MKILAEECSSCIGTVCGVSKIANIKAEKYNNKLKKINTISCLLLLKYL